MTLMSNFEPSPADTAFLSGLCLHTEAITLVVIKN
jgi:hypothetical protein